MKKKIATLFLSMCAIAVVAGCGSKGVSDDNISISQYKGVEVEKVAEGKVTDKDVEESIASTLEANKISNEVTDRAVVDTDTATIDFTGKKDGVEFEGGAGTDHALTIGSNEFIDGFEEGIIGHNIGDTFDLPLKFPEEYQSEDLAGKDVVFTVTVKAIATNTIPELTDKFVKEVSEKSKTVKEYKKEVKDDLVKSNKETVNNTLTESASTAVLKNTKVKKYPEKQVTKTTDKIQEQYTQMATYSGVEFAAFLEQQLGMTEAQFKDQSKKAAKESVKQDMAFSLIAKTEKLEPTDKEYKALMKDYAKNYGFETVDAMKKQVEEAELKKLILQDIVKAWLMENSVQVEPKAEDSKTEDSKTEDSKTEDSKTEDSTK